MILFDPPDPVRLRYFTTTTVLSRPSSSSRLERQDDYGIGRRAKSVRIEQIIPLVRTGPLVMMSHTDAAIAQQDPSCSEGSKGHAMPESEAHDLRPYSHPLCQSLGRCPILPPAYHARLFCREHDESQRVWAIFRDL